MNNGTSSTKKILILDAGAQYAKVIDRRVRELCVDTEILPLQTTTAEVIHKGGYAGIIISGGPASVNDGNEAPFYHKEIIEAGVPILGICYGMQLLNRHHGGSVACLATREDGQYPLAVVTSCPLFSGLAATQQVLLTHGDSVQTVAPGFAVTATSVDSGLVAGIANQALRQYGVQFHPEVDLTENGIAMLANFVKGVCGCAGDFTMGSREERCLKYIRERVGEKTVLMLVSGGVDSTVCAKLLHKALPVDKVTGKSRVMAVHVNNGFMRHEESAWVQRSLSSLGTLHVLDEWCRFYNGTTTVATERPVGRGKAAQLSTETPVLCQTTSPEDKRKIIGDTFVRVTDEFIRSHNLDPDNMIIGQGTLRPDLIESASSLVSSNATTIKTHHNDTDLVRQWRAQGKVVEPLVDFHKDEVRQLGLELSLPKEFVHRHPFPGPGLAIRILCATQPHMDADFSETQVILKVLTDYRGYVAKEHAMLARVHRSTSEAERSRLAAVSGQFCASLLPIRTVGVQGDGRSYSYAVALSSDQPQPCFASASALAKLIPKVCHNVNRVCYAWGGAVTQPVTEVTPTLLSPTVIQTLRVADHHVNQVLERHGLMSRLAQMPVVLIPIDFHRLDAHKGSGSAEELARGSPSARRSVVLRPFVTHDFMTGKAALPGRELPLEVVAEMVEAAGSVMGVSRVLWDLTDKPPGTTEWE